MFLASNSTISVIPNETAESETNWSCILVNSIAERISKLCVYCVVLLGSFFGNIFITLIVYKHRDLRKTINYFIVNMALSDLVFPLILLPLKITELVTGSQHWRISGITGLILCKFSYFASSASLFVSTQSLVWIAIDRFVAVVFPMKLGLISTKIRTIAIISTWIFAGVFNVLWLLTSKLVEDGNIRFCIVAYPEKVFPNQEAIAAYIWLHVTFLSIAPLFVITVLYSAIAISLKRQNRALSDSAPNVQRHSLKNRRQAIQMAVVTVVFFYICAIPQTLVHFTSPLGSPWPCVLLRPSIYFMVNFALSSSSVVNPIICLSFVESYRRGLRNILCSCCRKRNNKVTKCEQITLKRIKHIPDGNCG